MRWWRLDCGVRRSQHRQASATRGLDRIQYSPAKSHRTAWVPPPRGPASDAVPRERVWSPPSEVSCDHAASNTGGVNANTQPGDSMEIDATRTVCESSVALQTQAESARGTLTTRPPSSRKRVRGKQSVPGIEPVVGLKIHGAAHGVEPAPANAAGAGVLGASSSTVPSAPDHAWDVRDDEPAVKRRRVSCKQPG